ncbi:MAG TPA: VOC family protein, partial [Planctomycetota bacterium]|nr:VOC family protein [Planctomycetota bacterium]
MIQATRYVLAVPDLQISAAFYRDVLGFEIRKIDDPGWLFFVKDACFIMAGQCPDAIPPAELGDHNYFAYLQVDDVDAYHRQIVDRGGKITKSLRTEPWGLREFGIRTPDGYRIMIGMPVKV